MRINLRKVYRRFAVQEQTHLANELRRVAAIKRSPSTSGPPAGSLATKVTSKALIKVTAWGYVLRLSRLGMLLTWLVRGTKSQPPRPISSMADLPESFAAAVSTEAGRQIADIDRRWAR